MSQLMRNDLMLLLDDNKIFEKKERNKDNDKYPNAGLLIQKGLKIWDADSEKPTKKTLIDRISDIEPSKLYNFAFNRWLNVSFDNDEFCHLSATVNGRLFTGLALGGALETGAMTHHTYGMPMIAGSSIKGAVRSYTEYLFANRLDNGEIDYHIELKKDKSGKECEIKHFQFDETKQGILNVLFGKEGDDDSSDDGKKANAGYLIWHDAWWIPNVKNENNPFVDEIVTVHHQQYYQGNLNEALDIESPIPNQQIAITGNFYFTIQGKKAWVEYALNLLKGALEQQGLGAKGSNGYGYFADFDKLEENLYKRYQEMQPIDENDPLANIKKEISLLNDEQLIEKLSKEINKFFASLNLDKENEQHCRDVVTVVLSERKPFIEALAENKGKNPQKAYKFIEKYR